MGKGRSVGVELYSGASISGVLLQGTVLRITIMGGGMGYNPGSRGLPKLHRALGFDL